ncbi:MAG: trypsin-like peptidase domain-containing protein [Anaeroplasmataceae bacterium]|nr:trypsin-like peptidase domain-containing protein [Anaeroplasmataceae bacterium]
MKRLRIWIGISLMVLCLCLFAGCTFGEDKKDPTQIEKEPTIVEIQNDISEIYKKISKGCVGIYATGGNSGSVGSGVVYKNVNGLYYVVTNHHVIEDMTTVRIYRGGSRYLKATVVGSDAKNDVAVLTFSLDLFGGEEVYVNDIFSYDEEIVSVGQTVLAIGCPLGLENYNTLTTGVVSRISKTQIQTNAEINPGNSGGGLFNISGRLIGINTQKEVYTQGNENGVVMDIPVEGLGYAITLQVVKKCIKDIEAKKGQVVRPLLGVTVSDVNRYVYSPEIEDLVELLPNTLDEALVITSIEVGSTGSLAGLKENDIILKANDTEIVNILDFSSIMNLLLVGDKLKLEIYRPSDKQVRTFDITLK